MGLPSRIANQKYGTRTSAVAQVDNEEKSPSWFGNPRLRPPELIAQHFAGLHKAQPLQNSNIYLRAIDCFPRLAMRWRSSSRIRSSVGIARVSERIGAGSRDVVVADQLYRRRYASLSTR